MAVVVNYEWPVATPGSTTPPAASTKPPTYPAPPSSVAFNEVTAQITGDNTATSVVVTHNLGLSTAELSAFFPSVTFEPLASTFYTGQPVVTARAANTVTIGFNTTGVSAFALVRIRRPFAPTR